MRLTLPLLPRESRPLDFLAVGENSLDLVCLMRTFPRTDEKQRLMTYAELPGGQAATAAVACARLGWRTGYVGSVGRDRAADIVVEALRGDGVDVRVVTKNVSTRTAVVLVDQTTGSRTVLEARDEQLNVETTEMPDDVFASSRLVLVDGSDPALSLRALRAAREAGARTLLDIESTTRENISLLEEVDVAIVPADFVLKHTGEPDLEKALAALGETSQAAAVVATMGRSGASAWAGGQWCHVEAPATEVVDTTGAGDAFRAGFAAAWLAAGGSHPELSELLRFAARVAAWNCRTLGAQAGLPTWADLGIPRPADV